MSIETKMISFDITTGLSCEVASNPARSRKFSAHFSNAQDAKWRFDTIVEYMADQSYYEEGSNDVISRDGPPKDPFLHVLGVVDALSSDLTELLRMQWIIWLSNSTLRSKIPELGSVYWNAVKNQTPHGPLALSIGAFDAEKGQYSGKEDISYFHKMNTTMANLFVALRDAIYLDLGYDTPANVYVNRSMFNSTIVPDSYYPKFVSQIPYDHEFSDFSAPSWGWGSAPGPNMSWAQAFASTDQPVNNITLPIIISSPLPPSVINIMYLCPQCQVKSWGSLFMALFTGTFSAYASLYGLFAWLGPILDRERNGPQPLELLEDQHNRKAGLEGFDPLVPEFRFTKSSLDLEGPVKEHLLSSDLKEKS
ncbi:hypothetical protein FRC07_000011 [Ceratobasidium sp. 392]|nr:hypothetical protein FRC07_000011 [Ceratobasidium sp. 392]